MFKVIINSEPRKIKKAYDINALVDFIEENRKENTFNFLIEYTPISASEFLKHLILETNYRKYLNVYRIIMPTKKISNYHAKTKKVYK